MASRICKPVTPGDEAKAVEAALRGEHQCTCCLGFFEWVSDLQGALRSVEGEMCADCWKHTLESGEISVDY